MATSGGHVDQAVVLINPPVRAVPVEALPPVLPPRSPTRFCRKPTSVGALPDDDVLPAAPPAALPAGLKAAISAEKSLCSLLSAVAGLAAAAVAAVLVLAAVLVAVAGLDADAVPVAALEPLEPVLLAADVSEEIRFSSWLTMVLPLL